ncbi:MAG: MFS transporter [Burkholderiaceae bacterium]
MPQHPGIRQGLLYGLLGLPLAFVALPLYVVLPNHYARAYGVPLAALGLVLLAARLFDAFIDPLIGRWCDRLFSRSARAVLWFAAGCVLLLASGFALLFFPATRAAEPLLLWALVMLVLTYAGFSGLSVAHQAWGAMLGGDAAYRSRVVAWREGLGLAGVVLASLAPLLLGLRATVVLFAVLLVAGWLAWSQSRAPVVSRETSTWDLRLPFRSRSFRRLLAVFVLNGIASAIPATLVLFFVQDRLQAPRATESYALAVYFLGAAVSMPLWLHLVGRFGLARSWLCGMLLGIAAFSGAALLQAGDQSLFMGVCLLSGIALGADLALPGAMLAGVIARSEQRGNSAGAYFGWWNFATKLNLALAAGLALPVLAWFGYVPGSRESAGLAALTYAYCVLPCVLKLGAAALLYTTIIRTDGDT